MSDKSYSAMKPFFRHATVSRNSSYPFISGDTFRAMADHVFDETTDVNKWPERMSDIGLGDTVFLGTEVPLIKFFSNVTFNKIRHPFVLITHNSDASVPTRHFRWVLDNEKILAWFASNPDHIHKKLFPIPIGLANARWPHGNVSVFKQAFKFYRKSFSRRTTLLFVNFQVKNNRVQRSKALKWALGLPNVTHSHVTSHELYLRELGNAKFVLSPRGHGLDCHRTWETILMGAVPIVLRSRLDPLFTDAAVLIVDDWNNLSIEYLQSLEYNRLPNEILFAKYWRKRLMDVAKRE
ncbi:unnamed protein product [Rotaria sp. Silwood2]|nr:unnamed protein product [Rotaria sp. Silwood2]CAF4323561.1 unnamed protein product [Rotaria sp. Silwood2]